MEIDKNLYQEIKEYCDLNCIKPKEYIHTLLKNAFMKDKYGERPFQIEKDKKHTEIVKECIFGEEDGTNNAVSDTPEPVHDTKQDDVARNEESRQDVSINVSIPENVEKKDKNLDNKPKKRTIKPIK